MKIEWFGQAAFLITSDSGTRVITDPYTPGGFGLNYTDIAEQADFVTVSHDHADHANVAAVGGNPEVIKGPAEAKGIKFNAIASAHDDAGGSQRGSNIIYCFEVDGIKICHLGDLGHMLSDKQVSDIGKVDILLIPVGGNFTIDGKVATEVANKLAPKVIIPMHYQNERCPSFPVAGVDGFIEGKSNVNKLDESELEYRVNEIPDDVQIMILNPSR
ncbi:MBL fold metallo-hydrolase [Chloroflexota bacterium]